MSIELSPTEYLARRVALSIPLLFVIVIVCFVLIHSAPGDPVYLFVGEHNPSEEYIETVRKNFGLDRPLHEQLFIYITKILSGNFGNSIKYNEDVLSLIINRFPATLLLVGTALVFSLIIGVFLGVASAWKRGSLLDTICTLIGISGYSLPLFWVGLMIITVFSVNLGWLPIGGMYSWGYELTGVDYYIDRLRHMIGPVLTYSTLHIAIFLRYTKTSMLEAISQPFIITARAKGLSERTIMFKHALRNALLPVVTVFGMSLPYLVMGSILTESVFGWPGLGRLTFEAVMARDYPLIMGIFIIVSWAVIIGNLLADILYMIVDPRVRYKK